MIAIRIGELETESHLLEIHMSTQLHQSGKGVTLELKNKWAVMKSKGKREFNFLEKIIKPYQ